MQRPSRPLDNGLARVPFSALYFLKIEDIATFPERTGQTTVVLRAEPFGPDQPKIDCVRELRASDRLAQRYGGTFDRLTKHLVRRE